MYRVNPPLVRMVATTPVLFARPKNDWSGYDASVGARSERSIRGDFIETNGERIFRLHTLARWACIPFSLLGAYVCFRWARELYGDKAGILALALWCFSPNIMAYAQLIAPDAGATALGVAAAYCLWRWLGHPTWKRAVAAGVVLGLAELTKGTWIVLFGLWPLLWVVWRLAGPCAATCPHPGPLPEGEGEQTWGRGACQMGMILLLGLYVLNMGYGFEGSFQRLGDYGFVSETLGGPSEDGRTGYSPQGRNRFEGTWLAGVPVPLPKNYLMGIDLQRWDFERKMWSYLRGEWRLGGWWYYYLYALAIKAPLGTWVLVFLAAGVSLWGLGSGRTPHPGPLPEGEGGEDARLVPRPSPPATNPSPLTPNPSPPAAGEVVATEVATPNPSPLIPNPSPPAPNPSPLIPNPSSYSATWRDELVLLAPAAVVLTLVSSQTGFNHHLRYVLPIFPFVFIWASKVARAVDLKHWKIASIAGAALLWSTGSSLYYYPHSLSYFNELVGGPTGGHYHLGNSNIDWGQDLFYLKDWLDAHPKAKPLTLAYDMPLVDPKLAGIDYTGRPPANSPQPGWHAVSVNQIHNRSGQYKYFLKFKPVGMAGYSIYIYHVTLDEANRVRRELGMSELPKDRQPPGGGADG